jgi:hypothetical protein
MENWFATRNSKFAFAERAFSGVTVTHRWFAVTKIEIWI